MARVSTSAGEPLGQEMVTFSGNSPVARIHLPGMNVTPRPADNSGGNRVSMRQLQHPPSKNALKAFRHAQKYSEEKHYDKAAAELEHAIELSPDFAEARMNLGAQYLRLHKFEQAILEARRSMEIAAAPDVRNLTNSALASWALGRRDDALRFAKQAIALDRDAAGAHYIAGSMLIGYRETLREGIRHLELVADRMPPAAENLAKARQVLASLAPRAKGASTLTAQSPAK